MLSLMLKQSGFRDVAAAENGAVASKLVEEDPERVALVVLDSNMGGGDLGAAHSSPAAALRRCPFSPLLRESSAGGAVSEGNYYREA